MTGTGSYIFLAFDNDLLTSTIKIKIKLDNQIGLRVSVRFERGICEHLQPAPSERTKTSGCSLINHGQSERSGEFAL